LKSFAQLFSNLDASTATSAKVAALKNYFLVAPAADAAWATYFLAGGKPKQMVASNVLRQAALEATGISSWLFEESYQAVGDLAETIANLLPSPNTEISLQLSDWLTQNLLPLRGLSPELTIAKLTNYWMGLDVEQRFLINKLMTGGFRVGVSKLLVIRALSEATGVDSKVLTQRMIGYTDTKVLPTEAAFLRLTDASAQAVDAQRSGQPYPFFLAHPLLAPLDEVSFISFLGPCTDWQIEWKWDGIRAQLVKRDGQWWLWSRGEELITSSFPEIAPLAYALADGTVIDGEILAWDHAGQRPLPFAKLQQRIARKALSAKLLSEVPTLMIAYDILEHEGTDIRMLSQTARRKLLEGVAQVVPNLQLSERVHESSWPALHALREESRSRGVEGFMLKANAASYGVGRTKSDGIWWKWKVDPLTVDCVLIYAQRGHGRRASLYTDYTFAVWQGEALVPFAKAYSGLTDAEFKRVDEVIRKTTIDKFGPVRSVTPTLVFELGFEGIAASPRHKSGIAVRFPRILRWREDKQVKDADTLDTLKDFLDVSAVK
jgi:DNA ligase 1